MRALLLPPSPWPEVVALARRSAGLGADGLWFRRGGDPVVLLGAVSQVVEGMWLGCAVSELADRPPLLAAKQLVTLDRLSRGRFELYVDDEDVFAPIKASFALRLRPLPVHEALRVQRDPPAFIDLGVG